MRLYRFGGYHLVGSKKGDEVIKHPHKLVGKQITEKGFMSTTMHRNACNLTCIKYLKVMMIIENAANTNGLVIESISAIEEEKEVLLQRGTKYIIEKAEKLKDGTLVAYVRIIKSKEQKTNKSPTTAKLFKTK
jgi:hypothetical protein